MILLTRLNGSQFGINADLIERVETTGDTVISLIDGTKYVVTESPADVVDRIIEFRSRVLAGAELVVAEGELSDGSGVGGSRRPATDHGGLRLVVERTAPDEPDELSPDITTLTRSADAGPERS